MEKTFLIRIAGSLMTCLALCLVACSSDEDALDSGFMTTPNVDESIALAMAGGTYECAYELDTIKCYCQENGVIEALDKNSYDGYNFPVRGDYLEIKGNKAYSTLQLLIWHNMLKRQLDEYMSGNLDESYNSCYYLQNNFSYNIINSCIFEGNWTKYLILYADSNQIVIRYTNRHSSDSETIMDHYYKKTSPRDISQSYENYDDAFEAIASKYKEVFGEDKFNEMKEKWGMIEYY